MERLIPMNVEQIRRQGMKNAELQRKKKKNLIIKYNLYQSIMLETCMM